MLGRLLGSDSGRARAATLLIVGLACAAGYAAATPALVAQFGIPNVVLFAVAVLVACAVVGLRDPLIPLGVFLVWLPFGDLLRKLGSGDPRLALVRVVLLLIATVALLVRWTPWRELAHALKGWWLSLLICVGYFAATGVVSAFDSWQIPVSGLHLYFGGLPLVALGLAVAGTDRGLHGAIKFAAVVVSGVTLFGVLHGVLGADFLAPRSGASEYFQHLNLERVATGQTAPAVFQPSGFFVEPGRYANWAFANLAFGLALFELSSLRKWRYPVLFVGLAGVFTSAGRAIIISSLLLILVVALRRVRLQRRPFGSLVVRLLAVGAALYIVGITLFPAVVESRAEFLGISLNPFSSSSELVQRTPLYLGDTFRSLFVGGLFGRGLGVQSLGTQYLAGNDEYSTFGEGGFVTVAVETGVVGLGLWLWWTITWCRGLLRMARTVPGEIGSALAAIGYALALLLFVKFWFGINSIQDYVTNSAFFFAVGVVAGVARRKSQQGALLASVDDQHDLPQFPASREPLVRVVN